MAVPLEATSIYGFVVHVPPVSVFDLGPESPHLEQALTHPSYAHESPGALDNQRLEFLGDAILSFISSRVLYHLFPSADEGELTRKRAQIVSTEALAHFARHHNLGELIRFGKGGARSSLSDSDNVLADAVEALLAATYLDSGLRAAEEAANAIVEHALAQPEHRSLDPKSELQNSVQALGGRAPTYEVLRQDGPAHESVFEVVVRVAGREVGRGLGRSKKAAERNAALAALASKSHLEEDASGAES
jgi:ribonuclease III